MQNEEPLEALDRILNRFLELDEGYNPKPSPEYAALREELADWAEAQSKSGWDSPEFNHSFRIKNFLAVDNLQTDHTIDLAMKRMVLNGRAHSLNHLRDIAASLPGKDSSQDSWAERASPKRTTSSGQER